MRWFWPAFAPELIGEDYIGIFAKIAKAAARRGILVLIGCHRLKPDAWPGNGLWYDPYDAKLSEERVKESWSKVASELCEQWNVFVRCPEDKHRTAPPVAQHSGSSAHPMHDTPHRTYTKLRYRPMQDQQPKMG